MKKHDYKAVIEYGNVYWLDISYIFSSSKHCQRGNRPCVVVSNDFNNLFNDMVQCVPFSTKFDKLPMHRAIKFNGKYSQCLPEHIMTVDKRFLKPRHFITKLSKKDMDVINEGIRIQLNL